MSVPRLISPLCPVFFFFFNDTATTEIYTLSLHDALPICDASAVCGGRAGRSASSRIACSQRSRGPRSEEHTSELQSQSNLVCRLLLEKKKSVSRTTEFIELKVKRHSSGADIVDADANNSA